MYSIWLIGTQLVRQHDVRIVTHDKCSCPKVRDGRKLTAPFAVNVVRGTQSDLHHMEVMMIRAPDLAYFTCRAQETRSAASRATDQCVAIIHLAFAKEYDRRALECLMEAKNEELTRSSIEAISRPLAILLPASECLTRLTSSDRR